MGADPFVPTRAAVVACWDWSRISAHRNYVVRPQFADRHRRALLLGRLSTQLGRPDLSEEEEFAA